MDLGWNPSPAKAVGLETFLNVTKAQGPHRLNADNGKSTWLIGLL